VKATDARGNQQICGRMFETFWSVAQWVQGCLPLDEPQTVGSAVDHLKGCQAKVTRTEETPTALFMNHCRST